MTAYFGYLLAIGASLCWAIAPLIAAAPVKIIGIFPFVRVRFWIAAAFLLAFSLVYDRQLPGIGGSDIILILASSLIGVLLGEYALFRSISRNGAQLTTILYALHSPISVVAAYFLFAEALSLGQYIGIVICLVGVFVSVGYKSGTSLSSAMLWGLLSAICQSAGAIIIKPVLDAGMLGHDASFFRVFVAAVAATLVTLGVDRSLRGYLIPKTMLGTIVLNSLFATVLGSTLFISALQFIPVGIASILGSLAPVLVLPIAMITKLEAPKFIASIGAAIVVCGVALVLTN